MQKFCTNCGGQLPQDAKFCASCGTPRDGSIDQVTEPATGTPSGAVASQAQPVVQVVVPPGGYSTQPSRRIKSVGLAVFLNFIWPGVGHIYGDVNMNFGITFTVISGVMFLISLTGIGLILTIPVWLVMAIWSMIKVNDELRRKNDALQAG